MRRGFYERGVVDVARDLVGCVLRHGETAGVIVETEAYHESEPACHAYVGRTARTHVLFGPPGTAYVYRSYGIHALVNAVCEPEGVGAAVLIRALEPLDGIECMRERRGTRALEQLCSGPGKLTQALDVELHHNHGSLLDGPVVIEPRVREPGTQKRQGSSAAFVMPMRTPTAGSTGSQPGAGGSIEIGPVARSEPLRSSSIPSACVSLPGPEQRSSTRSSRRRARIRSRPSSGSSARISTAAPVPSSSQTALSSAWMP